MDLYLSQNKDNDGFCSLDFQWLILPSNSYTNKFNIRNFQIDFYSFLKKNHKENYKIARENLVKAWNNESNK